MKPRMNLTSQFWGRRPRIAAGILGTVLAFGLMGLWPADAADTDWTAGVSGSWFVPGNWSGGVPTAGDNAFLPTTNTTQAIIQGVIVATAAHLSIEGGGVSVGNIDAGRLTVSGEITVGTLGNPATLTLNYGTISVNTLGIGATGHYTDTTAGRLVLIGDNPTIKMAGDVTVLIRSTISGTNGLTKDGLGTLVLAANNTYSDGTVINAGTLQIGNGGTLGMLGAGDVLNNGTLVFNRSNTLIVSNLITGTGGVIQAGSGTTVFMADNTYSGGTTISGGTLQIGNGGTTGAFGSGDVLNNGTLAFNRSDDVTVANEISGSGRLRQNGTGTLIITANNTYSGGTTISAGTVRIDDGGALGSGAVTDHGTLAFNRSDTFTFANAISGTGMVAQIGSGTTVLTGNNTYSGSTLITAGTLQVGNGGTSGTLGTGAVSNDAHLAFNQTDTLVVANTITGSGSLSQLGTGTVTLTGSNSYAGTTTISAGTLRVGDGGTTGTLGAGDVFNNGTLVFNRSDSLTVSNLITGSGQVRKLGGGTMTWVADNDYTGPTIISSGTLQVGDGGTTGTLGTGDVTNNATLVFNRSDTLTMANTIAGSGTLSQNGTGTLVLTGTNTYSGRTLILAGALQVGNGGTAGNLGSGIVSNDAALIFNRSDAVTLSNQVTGVGSLTQAGSGTLILVANHTYSGSTEITAGTLQVGDGGTAGALGTGVVHNASALVFNRTNNITVANLITGTGSLTHAGAGALTLTATNTYSGGTWVSNDGTLIIKNSHALGTGGLHLLHGTLKADPLVIQIGGNYVQGADATLELAVAGTGTVASTGTNQFDQLNIAGTATLDGTLRLVPFGGYVPQHNDSIALLVASNGVSGTFAIFTNTFSYSVLLRPQLQYNANNVMLTWAHETFQTFALTRNQRAVAAALDSIVSSTADTDVALINYLDYLPNPTNSLPTAFDLIAPEELTAMTTLTFAGADAEASRVLNRVSYLGAGYRARYAKLMDYVQKNRAPGAADHVPMPRASRPWSLYADGLGEFLDAGGDNNAGGYEQTSFGLSIGGDTWVNEKLVVGLSGRFATGETDLSDGGSIDQDSVRGQLYAAWFHRGWHVEGMIGGGQDSYDTKRTALGGTATGSTDGTTWYVLLGAGYDWKSERWSFGPQAAVQYTAVNIEAFKEKGSLSPLRIAEQDEDALHTQLGIRLRYLGYVQDTWTFITPEVYLAWRHDFMDDAVTLDSQFASGAGDSFNVSGSELGSDSFVAGVGLTAQWTPTVATYFHYTGQLGRSGYDSHSLNLGVRVSF